MKVFFSERLKHLRQQLGITQEQLAIEIGVERSSIGKYEGSQKVIPSIDVLNAIADFFNVTTDYLLGRTDCPTFIDVEKEIPATISLEDAILNSSMLSDESKKDMLRHLELVTVRDNARISNETAEEILPESK